MKKVLAAALSVLLLSFCFTGVGLASGKGRLPFAVQIVTPENNIGDAGYYHIPGRPGQTIALQAALSNLTSEPLEIKAVPLNAYSGPDGIFYQSPNEVDSRLYSLADEDYGVSRYIECADAFTLSAGESKTVDIIVKVPDVDAGTLLGSIRFVVFTGTQQVQSAEGNNSAILIDTYQAIDTAIQIDLPGHAQSAVIAGTPELAGDTLFVPVVNQSAKIEENVSCEYTIRDARDSVMAQGSVTAPKMAPMSVLRVPAVLENGAWEKGSYTLAMQVNANGKTQEYTQPFSIGMEPVAPAQQGQAAAESGAAADDHQAGSYQTESLDTADVQRVIIYGIVFGVPAVFVVILLAYRKKRKKSSNQYLNP